MTSIGEGLHPTDKEVSRALAVTGPKNKENSNGIGKPFPGGNAAGDDKGAPLKYLQINSIIVHSIRCLPLRRFKIKQKLSIIVTSIWGSFLI